MLQGLADGQVFGDFGTVASFLQRLGRTGRRADTTRNCLFLCIDDESVLLAAGMLKRWSDGWVEPIEPQEHPRHIAAQQLMALCLQEHRITASARSEWWGDLPVFDDTADQIMRHLISEGFFEADGPFLGTPALFRGASRRRRSGQVGRVEWRTVRRHQPRHARHHPRPPTCWSPVHRARNPNPCGPSRQLQRERRPRAAHREVARRGRGPLVDVGRHSGEPFIASVASQAG